jgi:transcriptional regulator with PAS, ATPase and Fis domain
VFLDEIGDLEPLVQVKLLRVLETRMFQPVGGTTSRRFQGKIIAATNRDLAEGMRNGEFRQDFYYRLCSDVIVTPSLREQLRESPGVLKELLTFITRRMAGDGAESLAGEVESWILSHLGHDYPWPGNIRELEQCARNVLIRREYQPSRPPMASAREQIADALLQGSLTADAMLGRYCTLVFAQTGSYQETARRLRVDRRTVKSRLDRGLLEQLREDA